MSCSKKRYISKREAKLKMKWINSQSNFGLKKAYYCMECGCWHLTKGIRKTMDPTKRR